MVTLTKRQTQAIPTTQMMNTKLREGTGVVVLGQHNTLFSTHADDDPVAFEGSISAFYAWNKIFSESERSLVDDIQEFAENQESFSTMRFFPSAFVEPKLLYVSKTIYKTGQCINCGRSGVSMNWASLATAASRSLWL